MFGSTIAEERLKILKASKQFSRSGGLARAKKLSPKHRSTIASKAAKARWKNLQANAY